MTGQYAYRVLPDAVNGRNVVVTIGDPAALGSTPGRSRALPGGARGESAGGAVLPRTAPAAAETR